jgi:RNA-directed DNA polymerase
MEQTKAPDAPPSEEWTALPWRKLEQHLYRLQKRIFKASARADLKAVHQLQKLLMKSRSARLVAVRRVTQDNQGKKTAGIDGIKSVPPAGRFALAEAIHPKRMSKRNPSRSDGSGYQSQEKLSKGRSEYPLCMIGHVKR